MTLYNWPVSEMSQEKRRTGIPPKLLSWNGHNGTTMVTAGMFQEVDVEDAKSKTTKLFLCSGIQGRIVMGGAVCESTRLPQMWPGFESWRRRHMWVEFIVGSLLCSERFFSVDSGFPLFLKTNTSKFQFDLERTDTFQRVHKNSLVLRG